MGLGEVIKGSLSAEIGPVLIGVVSHAGSPRPESPTRQGSVAHIGREALALQQETSVEQASSSAQCTPSFPARCVKCNGLAGRSALEHAYLACSKADSQLTLYISDSLYHAHSFQPSRKAVLEWQPSLVLCVISEMKAWCLSLKARHEVCIDAQAEAQPLLERSASQKARHWTIATPKLVGAGALAGTSAGCLAVLSGIGGPPLILMYELLAVPKVQLSQIHPRALIQTACCSLLMYQHRRRLPLTKHHV